MKTVFVLAGSCVFAVCAVAAIFDGYLEAAFISSTLAALAGLWVMRNVRPPHVG